MIQLSYPYRTTGKIIALIFGSKVMSLLFNSVSGSLIAFLPRRKCISCLWSPSTVILEPKKIKSVTASIFSPFYFPWSDGIGCHDLSFLNVEFKARFFTLLFPPHQEALSSSISAIRVVSSAHLRLLILLLAVLIPACASSSLAFSVMHSAQKVISRVAGYSLVILFTQFWTH